MYGDDTVYNCCISLRVRVEPAKNPIRKKVGRPDLPVQRRPHHYNFIISQRIGNVYKNFLTKGGGLFARGESRGPKKGKIRIFLVLLIAFACGVCWGVL